MTKAELDAQIAALQAEKERLEAMTPEERAEAQRAAIERKQRESERRRQERDRFLFHAVNFPIAVLLVWMSNQDWLPLGWLSWVTYSNGGVALVGLLWYIADKLFFKGFDIYELAREKWQVAAVLACSYMFAATIGMLAGLAHIYIGGGSAAGHSAGVSAGNTIVLQFADRSDTIRTGGADRQRADGVRDKRDARPAGSGGGSER